MRLAFTALSLAKKNALAGEYIVGRKNYLIEGLSGTGKTTLCDALLACGYQAIHGDRALAYKGDPNTGAPVTHSGHAYHIWDVHKVQALVADRAHDATFFCGGSRNFSKFIHLFDAVFVLEADVDTLMARLAQRSKDDWGSKPQERAFVRKLHASGGDVPRQAIYLDATRPVTEVRASLLAHVGLDG